jgi:hypothetical protein
MDILTKSLIEARVQDLRRDAQRVGMSSRRSRSQRPGRPGLDASITIRSAAAGDERALARLASRDS